MLRIEGAELTKTRFAVPVSRLSLRGLSYPAAISLTVRLTCQSGDAAESEPATIQVVPAEGRVGQTDTRWPGYQFWVDPDGSFLFCDRSQIVRLDASGHELARSDVQVSCTSSTQLSIVGDRVVLLDGETATGLDASLKLAWRATGQPIVLSGGQLLSVKKAPSSPDSAMVLAALSLADGTPRWQTEVKALSGKSELVASPVLGSDGKVRLLTMSSTMSPLEGTLLLWIVDPARANAPSMTVLANVKPFPVENNSALAAPQGLLLPSGAAAVLAEYGAKGSTIGFVRLRAVELSSGKTLWEEALDHKTPGLQSRGSGALVRIEDSLMEVGADGQVTRRYTAPAGSRVREVNASSAQGVVLASLELGGEEGIGMVLLDAAFMPVWTVRGVSAFGAAVDAKGRLFLLGSALLKLYEPESYRALLTD